jgi:hypothetical protein
MNGSGFNICEPGSAYFGTDGYWSKVISWIFALTLPARQSPYQ